MKRERGRKEVTRVREGERERYIENVKSMEGGRGRRGKRV